MNGADLIICTPNQGELLEVAQCGFGGAAGGVVQLFDNGPGDLLGECWQLDRLPSDHGQDVDGQGIEGV